MSDSAFKTAPFAGYTTAELTQRIETGSADATAMRAEIKRREAVASGDMTNATPGERLRALKK